MAVNILCQSRPLQDLIQKEWPALMADLLNTGVWSREVWQAAQIKLQVLQANNTQQARTAVPNVTSTSAATATATPTPTRLSLFKRQTEAAPADSVLLYLHMAQRNLSRTTNIQSPQCIAQAPSFNPSCYGQAAFLDTAPVAGTRPKVGLVLGVAFGTLGGVLVLLAIAYFVAREKLKERTKQLTRTRQPSAAEGYRALQSEASHSQIRSTPGNSRHADGGNTGSRPGTNPRRSSLRASRDISVESNESLARDSTAPNAAAEATLTTGATVGVNFADEQPEVPPRRSSASLSAFAAALRTGLRMNHSAPPSPTDNSFKRETDQVATNVLERVEGAAAAGERSTSSAPMLRQHVMFASPVDAPPQPSAAFERRRSDSIALSSAVLRAQVFGQHHPQRRSTSPAPIQMPQPILRRPARQLPTPGDVAQPQPQYPGRSRSLTPVPRPSSPAPPGSSASPMPGSRSTTPNPPTHANTAPLPFASLAPPPMPAAAVAAPLTPSHPEPISVLTPVPADMSGGSSDQQQDQQDPQPPALPQQMLHVLDFVGPSISVHWLTFGHPPEQTAALASNISQLTNEWRSAYGMAKVDIPTHLMGWERTQARKAMGAAIVHALSQFESLILAFPAFQGNVPHQATSVRGMTRWFGALGVAAQHVNPSWISQGGNNPFKLATDGLVHDAQRVADEIWAPVMEASRVQVGRAVRTVLRAMMLIKAKVPYAAVLTVNSHGHGGVAGGAVFNPRVMMFDSADPVPSSPDGIIHVQCELFPGLVDASRTQVMVPCMVLG
ncbi:hypothetical protein BCR44DRAFT_1502114 [Catenaria anguillulae PL171]|uniref:Uncharacterized protein n=1 Tax=Catenaria anguillulae PL171 TaxID=765915 RepID=A0A1Y2HCJ9_9FUNG|nr:hypothetical protein BCR44DRAFT_1502114 [Catenaria anguillulae PL171]